MLIIPFSRRGLLGFALLPCLALAAEGPVHFGFSAHVNFPMSNLDTDLHGKVGAGASFQVPIETSAHTIVRPRLDFDVFPVSERDRPNSTFRDRVDLQSVGIGADFLYSFSGRNDQGPYGLGGLGVQKWFQTHSSRDTDGHDYWHHDDTVRNRFTPWLALGAGFQFNPTIGLEARAVGSKYNALLAGTSGTRTAIVTQLALTCHW
jgi:hypothetical protein